MAQRTVIRYAIEIAQGPRPRTKRASPIAISSPRTSSSPGRSREDRRLGLANIRVHQQTPATSVSKTVLTTPGSVIGTVGYMAPNRSAAKRPPSRGHLHVRRGALRDAHGKRPFEESTMVETLHAILKTDAPLRRLGKVTCRRRSSTSSAVA
jgi:hypothetical protein